MIITINEHLHLMVIGCVTRFKHVDENRFLLTCYHNANGVDETDIVHHFACEFIVRM